jgi:predicted nucleic-acid-binding Zn-ribbon protein
MGKSSKLQRFGRGLKAAVSSLGNTPLHFAIAGRQVTCPHCGGVEFDCREVLLNTRGATLVNLDWLNKGATALTCKTCTRIQWFAEAPETL